MPVSFNVSSPIELSMQAVAEPAVTYADTMLDIQRRRALARPRANAARFERELELRERLALAKYERELADLLIGQIEADLANRHRTFV